jgi:glycosyltransferase involved in cell wall biosynthesis
MRPRAVVVTPRTPWPLDDGGRIGLWQSLWSVAQEHDTTLVTLVLPGEEALPVPAEVGALGVEVVRVPHRPPPLPVALARGVLGRWPFTLTRFHSRALEDALRGVVARARPRFVHLNHLAMATHVGALAGPALVLREHNLEYRWLERYAERRRNPLERAFVSDQARRVRRAEGRLCGRMDLVLAIQDGEAEVLRALAPGVRVEVVPVGVDFRRFRAPRPASPPIVLLIGSYAWQPNADGALRFLEHGWPRVRARAPGARLRVVGKGLPAALAEAARGAGAEPVGYVEDAAPEFAAASALVVPLWTGAGTRVKIVEALAARVPVVSTALGAEGLGLEDGVHALLADEPGALGDSVARLLAEPALAARLAASGHALAEARFSLESVARRTNALCGEAADAREAAGRRP